MRILVAPDKFKGTFTAAQAAGHLARGLVRARPGARIDQLPLADGGDGTLDLVLAARGGRRVAIQAHAALDDLVSTSYGVTPDGTAVIESALICGLAMIPAAQRDVMRASSRGVGEVIAAALDSGIRRFLIGLGGTATVDGGAGMARALGYRMLDHSDHALSALPRAMTSLARVDASMAHPDIATSQFTALCDVDIPLLGPRGAVALFAPQKGAGPEHVAALESGLEALEAAVSLWKQDRSHGPATQEGAGAAGGLGFGVAAFLGGALKVGAAYLMDLAGFHEKAREADLVVTGEGRLDAQTSSGKVVSAVLRECAALGIRVAIVTGHREGALPAGAEDGARVFTCEDLPGRPAGLDSMGLEALGMLAGQDHEAR